MTIVIAVAALVALTLLALVRAVRADGYGRRPPPRSHPADVVDGWRSGPPWA